MSQSDKVFAGSIPEIYDNYLVPLIFQGFAEDMAQRVATPFADAVLETAAGSGVVTRALAPKLSQYCPLCRDRSQSADAGSRREAARRGQPHHVAAGRCA